MSKLKLPIIVIVLAAAGAGLFASGMVGGKSDGAGKKYVIEPITLAEPFNVNLADTDQQRLLAFNIAVKLEPMDEVHWAAFSGANAGGHGGGGEAPGPAKVATYPRFYDAVITVATTFYYDELSSEGGKAEFKQALLNRFNEIAEQDEATYAKGAGHDDPSHVGPPYHVQDLEFTKFVMQ